MTLLDDSEFVALLEIFKEEPVERGGPGSGHHGHKGRPGEIGGSLPSDVSSESQIRERLEERPTPTGHCFQSSANWVMDEGEELGDDVRLVHGTVAGKGSLEGIRYVHAWAEFGNLVYDADKDILAPKERYYELGDVKDTIEYTPTELRINLLKNKHWGPWDKRFEGGPWIERGGPGSGHHGHAGRPGEVGGSQPGKGGGKITIPRNFQEMADLYDLVPQEGENHKTRADYFDRIMGNVFVIAFEEVEALGDEIATMKWPEFSGMNWEFKKYDPRREDFPDLSDEQFKLLDNSFVLGVEHVRQQVHEWAIKRMIALGKIDPYDARDLAGSVHRPQGREWEPLPEVLYHVTTAAEAIREEGLKSRLELGMWAGRGLGGGESDTISFTADLDTARDIDRALHEGRLVARGEMTVSDMMQLAAEGVNADRPFLGELFYMSTSARGYRSIEIEEVNDALADDPTNIPEPVQKWIDIRIERENIKETGKEAWEFYNYGFARSRQEAGGPMYPLFFGTDYKALAASDPADFSILEFRPAEGAMGYLMGGLGEWRTVGGGAVELVGEHEEITPETEEELIGP